MHISMPTFKRNQVEGAIGRAINPATEKPSVDLLNRLKRLLDIDRSLGRSAKSPNPEEATYAFFSQDPAGSGIEVHFQEYEAFALLLGSRFLEHGFPQQKIVLTLRGLRSLLEREHARIMQLDPKVLFDQESLKAAARPGQMYLNNTVPVFLVISSSEEDQDGSERSIKQVKICRTEAEMMRVIKSHFGLNTIIELVGTAHLMRDCLSKIQPSDRGRPAKGRSTQ